MTRIYIYILKFKMIRSNFQNIFFQDYILSEIGNLNKYEQK